MLLVSCRRCTPSGAETFVCCCVMKFSVIVFVLVVVLYNHSIIIMMLLVYLCYLNVFVYYVLLENTRKQVFMTLFVISQ